MAGQVWAVDSVGGYMSAENLSKKLRMAVQPQVKFRQFCDVKDASQQGKKKGDQFHWDVYLDIATQGTTVAETNTVPESNFTIVQGTLTIDEAAHAIPYSGKLDDLSEHPLTEIINKVLKNDAKKFFDISAHAQFDTCLLRVYPTGGTATDAVTLATTGTVGGTSTKALNTGHVKAIVDLMKERNIVPYTGDDYYAISWPSTYRTFKNALETIHQYTAEGFGMIATGEIGRYENCRFIEQTHVAKAGTTYTDWCFFFGKFFAACCSNAAMITSLIAGKLKAFVPMPISSQALPSVA